jgi:hypothetical protein
MKKILTPVNGTDLRPGTLYRLVCNIAGQNNCYNDVQFIDSMSQGPVLLRTIEKLRAAGPLFQVYPYYPHLEVEWPDTPDGRHVVSIDVGGRPKSADKSEAKPKKKAKPKKSGK